MANCNLVITVNKIVKAVLMYLLSKRCIGGKHTPENKLLVSKTKWLNKHDKKIFDRAYKQIIFEKIIIRTKKRTGKGYDWHISLNPRKLKDMHNMIE